MKYSIFNNKDEVEKALEAVYYNSFCMDDALNNFATNRDVEFFGHFDFLYFVFGETITPNEIDKKDKEGVFSGLKTYGSSKKYKGVVSTQGVVIIPPLFDTIEPFWNNLIKVGRDSKYGIYKIDGNLVCPVEFDDFYDVSEYVFGARKDNRIGFFDTKGTLVIPFEYDAVIVNGCMQATPPVFKNGLACVSKPDERYGYIDHYGNMIFPFVFDYYKEFYDIEITNISTEPARGNDYRHDKYLLNLYGDMECIDSDYVEVYDNSEYESNSIWSCDSDDDCSDPLDAYEGDASNLWNTD